MPIDLRRIKELEAEVERLRTKIFDIEEREGLVTAELEHHIKTLGFKLAECHDKFVGRGDDSPTTRMRRHISELEEVHNIDERAWKKQESELLHVIEDRDQDIDTIRHDCELLDVILETVNPIIWSGNYAQPSAHYQILSRKMSEVCHDVIAFRRKHNIVGASQ